MDRLLHDPTFGRLLGIFATTYEMQPEFVETDFLPTILELGAWDDRNWSSRIALERSLAGLECASILMDARPYRGRPRSLQVEVIPASLTRGRKLHAKVLVGVFERAVRLAVGSANLTEPGYRRNREVIAVLTASPGRPENARLIAGAIEEMGSILEPWLKPGARELRARALAILDEWGEHDSADDRWFTWSGGGSALWERFLKRWPANDRVKNITIVSPFWSEEGQGSPISSFVGALSKRDLIARGTTLLLLTEAAPETQTSYKPKLPETFAQFDARNIGVDAIARAVDPRVAPGEVGLEDLTGTRNLHAKVVLLEGGDTSLVYIGSANFTRRGWGFLEDPSLANIEAGLIIQRSGPHRNVLRSLIPEVTGDPVSLAGAAAGHLALTDPTPAELPWPSFLGEVVLAPSTKDAECLELVVTTSGEATGPWSILHLPVEDAPPEVLLAVAQTKSGAETYRLALGEELLIRLLREQEVHVQWWEYPDGRSFPINVALAARTKLPFSPGTGRLGEQGLIAYYQGKVRWEDLFHDPDDGEGSPHQGQGALGASGVDTTRIQSYIVREFVEAIKGIRDDLKTAAQAPRQCMRLALAGAVSPVALARCVVEAIEKEGRTPTATGFQLVEILACLDAARQFEAAPQHRIDWARLLEEATSTIAGMLDELQRRYPRELSRDFRRYTRTVRQLQLRQAPGR
jgi:hypothetical protein